MGKGNCKGGTCSSKDEKHEDNHHSHHGCGCHNHEDSKHECGCGHNHHSHEEHECGCGHEHHSENAEHGNAHVTMTSEEELVLLKQYLENLNTEKDLVEKRIEELKKEVKE